MRRAVIVKLVFFLLTGFIISCKDKKKNDRRGSEKNYLSCSPAVDDKEWYLSGKKAPIINGLEGINFPVTTSNQEALKYFNQGMMLSFGFNHAEAARSFYQATKLDSAFAMSYWGYAYVLGPNYNAGMEPDHYSRAFDAVSKAMRYKDDVSVKERELIKALVLRYPPTAVEDRSIYDKAYAAALRKLYKKYPADPNIGALYAEALMDLHPWDLWKKDGNPQPWTNEIVSVLENVIKLDPNHVGGHHFYIHAVEASKNPGKGLLSAKKLEGLVPGAGHLVHMPSHIYIRTGRYHEGSLANLRAVKVDSIYTATCHAQGIYPLAYFPHNYHFLSATATLEGNAKLAIESAQKVSDHVHPDIMKQPEWGTLQHYYAIPYYVAIKFGLWDDILNWSKSEEELDYPNAVRSYARGMAFLGKGKKESAKKEFESLSKLATKESLKEITIWDLNSVYTLMQIASLVLQAEILTAEEEYTKAIDLLRRAIEIEDALNYDEPPDWFFSVRHNLGNIQLLAGKYGEAIKTFNEDLENLPENGWALSGLYSAYSLKNDHAKATLVKSRLDEAWKYANVKLEGAKIKN